jgi:hypothetical protein
MKWHPDYRDFWVAYASENHTLDVYPHAGGFAWCTCDFKSDRGEKIEDAPQGWSGTLDDAKAHAEAAYFKWVEEMRDAKVLEERAAVVAWLRERSDDWRPEHLASFIEQGKHRRGGGA